MQQPIAQQQASTDTDSDRFPTAITALQRIAAEGRLPQGPIERIDIRALASGEVTYKTWEPRAEEGEAGYIGPPE